MARNEQYPGVLKTPYSKWHRSLHNGISMTDIDKISQCPACGKCLLIGDLIFNANDQYKTKPFYTKRAYLEISTALQIPYFEIFYTTIGKADNGALERLSVRRIAPSPGKLHHINLDNWLEYLEMKVQEHIKVCQRKDYLLKRITEINEHNKNFTRRNNYVKLLSNRS
ncbi:putative oxidoreductase [uncultured Mediterranean phage uvMED]|nr:putative oxidoreductase [uncultured Mediterranean phage uvMED]